MNEPFVSIIIRSFNEGWALRDTLPAVQAQDYKNWELIIIDSGSTDGSVELIRKARPAHFIQIEPGQYNPSRVMNQGMGLARSEFGIFLNADATPQGTNWLRPLVEALQDTSTAAVFGKQIPRPNCRAVFAHDYERCFGKNRESKNWEHFFSMVSSGLRKDIWRKRGFLETLQYSEDDEYTRWCRAQGYRVVYVPKSVVMHSHNYTPKQAYKRSFGEAKALAAVWNDVPTKINFSKTVLLGWANDARRDLKFCSHHHRLNEWPHAARIRWHQRRAKLAGFREGWKFYRNKENGNIEHRTSNIERRNKPESHNNSMFRVRCSVFDVSQPRFTLDGNDGLEKDLLRVCENVLIGVQSLIPPRKLDALVLGGGYGRGEGGVLKSDFGDQAYNDLEFYVFLRGNRIFNERKYNGRLNKLGEQLSTQSGLHVEFKLDSLARLRQSPVTMFSYDLVSGHRVIWDGETGKHRTSNVFLGCEHHLDAEKIPLSEATRLLMNRCTGLLLAKEFLDAGHLNSEEIDFVARNIAKAQLAFGDAVLTAFGKYHWSCLERHDRLANMANKEPRETYESQISGSASAPLARTGETPELPGKWINELCEHHANGVEFKLHPQQSTQSLSELQQQHQEISNLAQKIWLWLENQRLNQSFSSARDYALSPIKKCDGTLWRNMLLNIRTFGLLIIFDGMAARYPRERLLNSLPLLLWEESLTDLKIKLHLQNQLQTTASDWQGLVAAYKKLWPNFS